MSEEIEKLKRALKETDHALEQKTYYLLVKEQDIDRKTVLINELKTENSRLSK